ISVWLMQNTSCDSATHDIFAEYNSTRRSQRESWLNDTTVPYDTTLPSMAELGLDTLLAKHFLFQNQKSVKRGPDILTTVTAAPNPTGTGTTLTFGMRETAYVRLEMFDVLGSALTRPLPK